MYILFHLCLFNCRSELYLVISPLGERMCRNVHLCSHQIFLLIPTLGVKDANAHLLYKICEARSGPATHFYAELHCICTMMHKRLRLGYSLQFCSIPPPIVGIWEANLSSWEQIERSRTTWRNRVVVPPHDRENSFTQNTF